MPKTSNPQHLQQSYHRFHSGHLIPMFSKERRPRGSRGCRHFIRKHCQDPPDTCGKSIASSKYMFCLSGFKSISTIPLKAVCNKRSDYKIEMREEINCQNSTLKSRVGQKLLYREKGQKKKKITTLEPPSPRGAGKEPMTSRKDQKALLVCTEEGKL